MMVSKAESLRRARVRGTRNSILSKLIGKKKTPKRALVTVSETRVYQKPKVKAKAKPKVKAKVTIKRVVAKKVAAKPELPGTIPCRIPPTELYAMYAYRATGTPAVPSHERIFNVPAEELVIPKL